MSARPTDGSDRPEAVDPVMSAVLSNRGRVATPRAYSYFNRELPRRQPRLF